MLCRMISHAAMIVCVLASLAAGHPPDTPLGTPAPPESTKPEQIKKQIEWFESRVQAEPGDTIALSSLGGAWLRIARLTTRHEDFEAAAKAFEQLREHNEDSLNALIGLAHARMGQHRFAEALRSAQAAVCARQDDIMPRLLLGDVHLAIGNTTEAGLIFDDAAGRELTLESLSRVALVRDAEGKREQAETAMKEAIEAGTLLKVSETAIGWCESMLGEFALQAGQLNEAEAHFKKCREMAPDVHNAVYRLADIARRRGDVHGAEGMLAELVERMPLPRYLVLLGDVKLEHATQHHDEEGQTQAREVLARAERLMTEEIKRGDVGHARELVEFWLTHGGDFAAAAELALRELNEVRHDAGAFEVAAWALHKAGRDKEAAPLMQQSLDRNPTAARALLRAAIISDAAGRKDEAVRLRNAAEEANPRVAADSTL